MPTNRNARRVAHSKVAITVRRGRETPAGSPGAGRPKDNEHGELEPRRDRFVAKDASGLEFRSAEEVEGAGTTSARRGSRRARTQGTTRPRRG